MSYIDAYSGYRDNSRLYLNKNEYSNRADNNSSVKSAAESSKTTKTGESLSADAKKLLKELQQKYGDTDFFVANYDTDEEANAYLSRGSKEYSVLIEPDILEEMAKDKATKDKYLGVIEDARGTFDDIKEELTKSGDNSKISDIKSIGISVKNDGKVSLFAQMEKSRASNNAELAKRLEKRKEQKKAESKEKQLSYLERIRNDKDGDKIQSKTLSANNKETLIEQIKKFCWEDVPEDIVPKTGSRFDMVM